MRQTQSKMCQVLAILEFVLSSHRFHGYHHRIRSVEYLLPIEGGVWRWGAGWSPGPMGGRVENSVILV